mmetsp:Transcript_33039/g.76838  ORF Transcript_33039/g.76838 Transcript_33039/m.76838 type:complete len:263 (-) Transcript_33039:1189-1977(-)
MGSQILQLLLCFGTNTVVVHSPQRLRTPRAFACQTAATRKPHRCRYHPMRREDRAPQPAGDHDNPFAGKRTRNLDLIGKQARRHTTSIPLHRDGGVDGASQGHRTLPVGGGQATVLTNLHGSEREVDRLPLLRIGQRPVERVCMTLNKDVGLIGEDPKCCELRRQHIYLDLARGHQGRPTPWAVEWDHDRDGGELLPEVAGQSAETAADRGRSVPRDRRHGAGAYDGSVHEEVELWRVRAGRGLPGLEETGAQVVDHPTPQQ